MKFGRKIFAALIYIESDADDGKRVLPSACFHKNSGHLATMEIEVVWWFDSGLMNPELIKCLYQGNGGKGGEGWNRGVTDLKSEQEGKPES